MSEDKLYGQVGERFALVSPPANIARMWHVQLYEPGAEWPCQSQGRGTRGECERIARDWISGQLPGPCGPVVTCEECGADPAPRQINPKLCAVCGAVLPSE